MSVTTVRLQPEVESGLEAMADKLSRSKSWLINQALREYLERQEEAERGEYDPRDFDAYDGDA
jgi:predicted transcriptional regulator